MPTPRLPITEGAVHSWDQKKEPVGNSKRGRKSISTAAASVIAKVYRDNPMRKLAKKHPKYGRVRKVLTYPAHTSSLSPEDV